MIEYPVITLWQPWTSWIAEGWKTIETRTHRKFSCLAGRRILIHAGSHWDRDAIDAARNYLTPEQIARTSEFYGVFGKILCSAWVNGHLECCKEDERKALIECRSIRRYGLWLSNIKKIEPPILTKGKQGIWYYNSDKEL